MIHFFIVGEGVIFWDDVPSAQGAHADCIYGFYVRSRGFRRLCVIPVGIRDDATDNSVLTLRLETLMPWRRR